MVKLLDRNRDHVATGMVGFSSGRSHPPEPVSDDAGQVLELVGLPAEADSATVCLPATKLTRHLLP